MSTRKRGREGRFLLGGTTFVNRVGLGTMQLTGPGVWGEPGDRAAAQQLLQNAVAGGVNFFDTADSFGPGTVEQLIHESLNPYYDEIVIATKGGLERGGPGQWYTNGHPTHIARAIDESLLRLGKEQIQLWQLHRVDPRIPVEDTLVAVAKAVAAGKIAKVGLSEVDIPTIERARKVVPIATVQNLYHLNARHWDDVLEHTARTGIAFIPWFPLASGPGNLRGPVTEIAARHEATPAQIALAFLLRRSPNILLIPGTRSIDHLQENLAASSIQLSDEDYLQLLQD